jgi:hypothetical protein
MESGSMTKNQPYNDHKNWTHWNVSLWLNNEEWMYRELMQCVEIAKTRNVDRAARVLQGRLPERTPDKAFFSIVALKAAIQAELDEVIA